MRPRNTACPGRRGAARAWPIIVALLVGAAAGMALPRPFGPARASQPAPPAQPPGRMDTERVLPIATHRFESPAAMIVNFVQPASAGGFEALTRRLVRALAASEDRERQAQAAGWTMYRAREMGTNNNTVFVWLLDPAVANANYAVPQLLNEMFPDEVQQLYESYNRSFGVGRMQLSLDPVVLAEDPR